jgi:hypothetical protein
MNDIPVNFVVGHARLQSTEARRKPYVELVKAWAEHEQQTEAALSVTAEIMGQQLMDITHLPKEILPAWRSPERAQALINVVRTIDKKITNQEEWWTWDLVMRVMVDDGILSPRTRRNRFDGIICLMVPGKSHDTVRKSGTYEVMEEKNNSWHSWVSNSLINPEQAENRAYCEQISQLFSRSFPK